MVLPILLSLSAFGQEPSVRIEGPVVPPPNRNYVAAVIGLSSYEHLPDAVELDFARSDAATVAKVLRRQAFFSDVFLLADGEATKEAIRDVLRTQVPQLVGPNDVFLLYFVGHGIGADLDLPVFLAYDSTLANGQEDGLELTVFARDLQTMIRAETTVIITDAIHRNNLDGINFWGPAASEWPRMPRGTMVISSSQARSPARDGAFGEAFAAAISGGADADRDSLITASELFTSLVNTLSPSGQIPTAAGDFSGGMVVAEGVTANTVPVVDNGGGTSVVIVDRGATVEPVAVEETYPEYEIRAAKFVWKGGGAQSVRCREQEIAACAPSCYVRTFKAGPCDIEAVYDGVRMEGRHVVLGPGKYDCYRRGGALECAGP